MYIKNFLIEYKKYSEVLLWAISNDFELYFIKNIDLNKYKDTNMTRVKKKHDFIIIVDLLAVYNNNNKYNQAILLPIVKLKL